MTSIVPDGQIVPFFAYLCAIIIVMLLYRRVMIRIQEARENPLW